MASLKDLKKQSSNALDKLRNAMTEEAGSGSTQDDRIWRPHYDQDKGTGYAKLRFLPAPAGEDLPWVRKYVHSFKGPTGKWYIENSLTTVQKDDPVGNLNNRLWNSGIESDKEIARKQKRKQEYFANVLVLEDPHDRDNEGKIFLYKFGPTVYNMIKEKMNPEFDDETPINPFDAWEGATLVVKMRKQDGYVKYDKSYWEDASPISQSDDEIEEIWNKTYSLKEIVSDSQFKTYDELKNRLFEVLGPTVGANDLPTVEGMHMPPTTRKQPTTSVDEADSMPPTTNNLPTESAASVSDDVEDIDIDSLFD